jgi:hypothetical protein
MTRAGPLITRRAWMIGMLPLGALASNTRRPPQEIEQHLPGARLVGQGRMRFFGVVIYDIRLWSPARGAHDITQRPFGLELEYSRMLKGERIAQRSLDEMRRIGEFTPQQRREWLDLLMQLLPDVGPGDRLTGLRRQADQTEFFHNGTARGELKDTEFTRLFFGIWLAPNTSEPQLREQLLGLRPEPTP